MFSFFNRRAKAPLNSELQGQTDYGSVPAGGASSSTGHAANVAPPHPEEGVAAQMLPSGPVLFQPAGESSQVPYDVHGKDQLPGIQTGTSWWRFCSVGADLPDMLLAFGMFVTVLVITSLSNIAFLKYLAMILCYSLSLGFMWFSRNKAWRMRAVWCLVLTLVASIVGYCVYHRYVGRYNVYSNSPQFLNMMPNTDPAAVPDAAFLGFSPEASVRYTQSVGMRDGELYCVAPILASAMPVPGTQPSITSSIPPHFAGFWAVGKDCCRSRGGFTCGGAQSSNSHGGGGVVLLPGGEDEIQYLQAIQMAAATYQLAIPQRPTLVLWGESQRSFTDAMFRNANLTTFWVAFSMFVVTVMLTTYLNLVPSHSLAGRMSSKDESVSWHPERVKQMSFGFDVSGTAAKSSGLQDNLLHATAYWSGEVLHDYAFHISNSHMFIGCIASHPHHPYSKWERAIVCIVICLLVVFPVSLVTVALDYQDTILRTVLVLIIATIPRNLLKMYLLHVTVADSKELLDDNAPGARTRAKNALLYELRFMTFVVAFTGLVVVLCSLWINAHTERPLGWVLSHNLDGLAFAFVLEPLIDLVRPRAGKGRLKGSFTIGFFGQWCNERDIYEESYVPTTGKGAPSELHESYTQGNRADIESL